MTSSRDYNQPVDPTAILYRLMPAGIDGPKSKHDSQGICLDSQFCYCIANNSVFNQQ